MIMPVATRLFLASMARLHCGHGDDEERLVPADPLPGLHGQAPLRAGVVAQNEPDALLFLASMARLHCGDARR